MTFSSPTPSVCSVTGSTVSFVGVGTCTVDADQAGNANYGLSSRGLPELLGRAGLPGHHLHFDSAGGRRLRRAHLLRERTGGGSGNPVTFSSPTPSVCSVTGSTVSFVGVGTCTVDADQAGNANDDSAPEVSQSFSVGQATSSAPIVSNLPASGTYGGGFIAAVSTTGDGTTSVTSPTPSVCMASGLAVSYVGVGTCTLTAHVADGIDYLAADGSPQSFSVGQAAPTTPTISNLPASGNYGGGFTATVSTTGDGSTSVTSSTTSVCTASGLSVSYVGVGTCSLTAHVADGTDYLAADGSPQSVPVAGFTITTSSIPGATPGTPYGPVTLQTAGAGTSTSPYTTTVKWKKVMLPKGLALSSIGVLSGTPNKKLAAGPSSVTIQVTETVTTLNGKKKVKTKTTVQATIPLTIN